MQLRVADRVRPAGRVSVLAGSPQKSDSHTQMNRSAAQLQLVGDGGPPRCPACGIRLYFGSDRQGQTYAQCDCGYRAYVERRTGKREEPVASAAGI